MKINNENEEIVLDESSNNNHIKRKINGNLDHKNFTWKKHKPSGTIIGSYKMLHLVHPR